MPLIFAFDDPNFPKIQGSSKYILVTVDHCCVKLYIFLFDCSHRELNSISVFNSFKRSNIPVEKPLNSAQPRTNCSRRIFGSIRSLIKPNYMQNNILKVPENRSWTKKFMIVLLQGTFLEIRKVCVIEQ